MNFRFKGEHMKVKIYERKDIEKAYKKGYIDGVRQCIDDIMATVTICLQDRHGWKQEQLLQLEKEVNDLFNNVIEGRVDFNEIVEAKEEEIGRIDKHA